MPIVRTTSVFIIALATVAGMSSCAVGRKMSFENKEAGPGYPTTKTAIIVFQEKRAEVLAGREKPTFCGHSNSTAQISYNTQTESGKPLADEFTEAVTTAYNKSGGSASMVMVNMNTSVVSFMQVFKNSNKDRLLYFSILKWESRATPLFSSIRNEVIYQLELNVYNPNGDQLATNSTQNIVVKEEGVATSMKKMQAMADDTFKDQIRNLFSSESVKKSLL